MVLQAEGTVNAESMKEFRNRKVASEAGVESARHSSRWEGQRNGVSRSRHMPGRGWWVSHTWEDASHGQYLWVPLPRAVHPHGPGLCRSFLRLELFLWEDRSLLEGFEQRSKGIWLHFWKEPLWLFWVLRTRGQKQGDQLWGLLICWHVCISFCESWSVCVSYTVVIVVHTIFPSAYSIYLQLLCSPLFYHFWWLPQSVSIPYCCCEHLPWISWLKRAHIYYLTVLEVRIPKIMVLAQLCPFEASRKEFFLAFSGFQRPPYTLT